MSLDFQYNTSAIRQLLNAAFSDEDLEILCYDYFREVYDTFGQGMRKDEKINRLLDYCYRFDHFDELLHLVKQENPAQFDRFETQIYKEDVPQKSRGHNTRSYNLKAISELLNVAFDDVGLSSLCMDYFREVYLQFSTGMRKGDKIDLLLDHCDRFDRFDELLHLVKQYNPVQFDRFKPDFYKSEQETPKKEDTPTNRTTKFPSFSHNPYIAGPPVTDSAMFFGRQFDLERIISLLARNFVMLVGPRRNGKTSLLYQLARHLPQLKDSPEKFVPVMVNVEGTPQAEFFHTVMEEIVNVTQESLTTEAMNNLSFDLSVPTYPPRVFSRDLQIILRGLQSTTPKPSRLVLLLDEMDTLNSYSLETQSQLRRIFQRFTNHNLSVVVAGVKLQQHWAGESSPFYNMFMPVPLTPFPETEARRLITEPVKNVYSYDTKAIAHILKATSCMPHRIQQLCLNIIHHLRATAPKRTEITVEDVDSILQTIHWLDEEISEDEEAILSPTLSRSPLISEEKAHYQTKDLKSGDREKR